MIVDFHTHIFPPEIINHREKYCSFDRGFSEIYSNKKAKLISAEELIEAMRMFKVDVSVICGFPWTDKFLCKEHNDYLLSSSKKYNNKLVAFNSITLSDIDFDIEETERCFFAGARGVGEIAKYDFGYSEDTYKYLNSIANFCRNNKYFILIHQNECIGHQYAGKIFSCKKHLYNFLLKNNDLNIVLAHWGGGLIFFELMPEIERACKNVFYDTAASPYLYDKRIYKIALEIVKAEKILFGSDYPLIKQSRYINEIFEIGLKEEDIKKILGENARKLLNL